MVLPFDQYLRQQYPGGYGPAPAPQEPPPLTPEEEAYLLSAGGYGTPAPAPAPAPEPAPAPAPESAPAPMTPEEDLAAYEAQQYAAGNTYSTGTADTNYYAYGGAADPMGQVAPPAESGYMTQQETVGYYADPANSSYTTAAPAAEPAPAPAPEPARDPLVLPSSQSLQDQFPGGYGPGNPADPQQARTADRQQLDAARGNRPVVDAVAELPWEANNPRVVAQDRPILMGEGVYSTIPEPRQRERMERSQSLDQLESAYGSLDAAYNELVAGRQRTAAPGVMDLTEEERRNLDTVRGEGDLIDAARRGIGDLLPDAPTVGDFFPGGYGPAPQAKRDTDAIALFRKPYAQLSDNQKRAIDGQAGPLAPVGEAIRNFALSSNPSTGVDDATRAAALAGRGLQDPALEERLGVQQAGVGFGGLDPVAERAAREGALAARRAAEAVSPQVLTRSQGGRLQVPVNLPGAGDIILSPENYSFFRIAADEANRQAGDDIYIVVGNVVQRGVSGLGKAQADLFNEQFSTWLRTDEGRAALDARFTGSQADAEGLVGDWVSTMGFWESMWELGKADPTIGIEAIATFTGLSSAAIAAKAAGSGNRFIRGSGKVFEAVNTASNLTEVLVDPVFNGAARVLATYNPKTQRTINELAENSAREAAEGFLQAQPRPGTSAPQPNPPAGPQPNPPAGPQPQGPATPPQPNPPAAPQPPAPNQPAPQPQPTPQRPTPVQQRPAPAPQPQPNPPAAPQQAADPLDDVSQMDEDLRGPVTPRQPAPAPEAAAPAPAAPDPVAAPAAPDPAARTAVPTLPERGAYDIPFVDERTTRRIDTFATPEEVPFGRIVGAAGGRERYYVGRVPMYFVEEGSQGRWFIMGNGRGPDGRIPFGYATSFDGAMEQARILYTERAAMPDGTSWTGDSVRRQTDEMFARRQRGELRFTPADPTRPQPAPQANPPTVPQQAQAAPGDWVEETDYLAAPAPEPAAPGPAASQPEAAAPRQPTLPPHTDPNNAGGRQLIRMSQMTDAEYNAPEVRALRRRWYVDGFLDQGVSTPRNPQQQQARDRSLWLDREREANNAARTPAAAESDPNLAAPEPDWAADPNLALNERINAVIRTRGGTGDYKTVARQQLQGADHGLIRLWITEPLAAIQSAEDLGRLVEAGIVDEGLAANIRRLQGRRRIQLNAAKEITDFVAAERRARGFSSTGRDELAAALPRAAAPAAPDGTVPASPDDIRRLTGIQADMAGYDTRVLPTDGGEYLLSQRAAGWIVWRGSDRERVFVGEDGYAASLDDAIRAARADAAPAAPGAGGPLPGMQDAMRPVMDAGPASGQPAMRNVEDGGEALRLEPQVLGSEGQRQNEILNGQADMFAAPAAPVAARPGEQDVRLSDLSLDETRFQPGDRRASQSQMVQELVDNWDEATFQRSDPLQVWRDPADGRLYVISGQHRATALKQRAALGMESLDRPVRVVVRDDLATLADAQRAARTANIRREEALFQKADGMSFQFQQKLREQGLDEATMTGQQYDAVVRSLAGASPGEKERLLSISRLPNVVKADLAVDKPSGAAEKELAKLGAIIGDEAGTARGRPVVGRADVEAVWTAYKAENNGRLPSADDIDAMRRILYETRLAPPAPGQGALFDTGSLLGPVDGDFGTRVVRNLRAYKETARNLDKAINEATKRRKTLEDAIALSQGDMTEVRMRALVNEGTADPTMTGMVRALDEADRQRMLAIDRKQQVMDEITNGTPPPTPDAADAMRANGAGALFDDDLFNLGIVFQPRTQAQALRRTAGNARFKAARALGRQNEVARLSQTVPGMETMPAARPGSWAEKSGAILTDAEEAELSKYVTDMKGRRRQVGDVVVGYRNQLEAARGFLQSGQPLTPQQEKFVKRIVKHFDLDNAGKVLGGQDAETLLRNMDDRIVNRLAAERIAVDTGIERGARKASGQMKETDIFGRFRQPTKAVQLLDKYLSALRIMTLYSPHRGPAYATMQMLGNATSLGLARPTALNDYISPVDWRRIYRRVDDGRIQTTVDLTRERAGLPRSTVLGNKNTRDEIASGSRIDSGPLFFTTGVWRKLGNVFDTHIRESIWNDVWQRDIGQLGRDLEENVAAAFGRADQRVRRAGGTPFPFDPAAVRQAVADLRGASGNATFSADDVRNALNRLYDDALAANPNAPLPPRGQWANFADRMGRDWKEALRDLDRRAIDEVKRVAFSFEETVADSVARRFFLFHYWNSRASALYVKEGLKKPWLAAAYFRAMEQMERENEQNKGPAWMTGFLKFAQTPAGYTAFWNPLQLFNTAATFADMGEKSDNGLTELGAFTQNVLGERFMPNPLITELFAAAGLMGPKFSTPNVLGDAGTMDMLERAINEFAIRENLTDRPVFIPDSRDALNWLNRITSGVVAGTDLGKTLGALPVGYKSTDAFKETQFNYLMMDVVKERFPPSSPEAQAFVSAVDPGLKFGTPQWDAQYEEFVQQVLAGKAADADPAALQDISEEAWSRYNQMRNASLTSGLLPGVAGDVLGAVGRQASPFPVITSADQQAADMAASREAQQDPNAPPPPPPTAEDLARKEARQTRQETANAADPRDRGLDATIDFFGNPEVPVGDPEGRWLAKAYGSIKGGQIDKPFTVGGQTYTPEQVQVMTPEERAEVAALWMDEYAGQKGWDAMSRYFDAKDEFYADNPDAAAVNELGELAKDYPGGAALFAEALAANNPGYATFLDGLKTRSGGTLNEDALGLAFSQAGYEALTGRAGSVYDPAPETALLGPRVPMPDGTIQQVDLAAAAAKRRAADDAEQQERNASRQERLDSVNADFATLDGIKQDLLAWDPSGATWQTYVNNLGVPSESRARLPKGAYDLVKDRFAGQDGTTYDYPSPEGWVGQYSRYAATAPPGAVLGFEDWLKQYDRERKAQEQAEQQAAGTAAPAPTVVPASIFGRTVGAAPRGSARGSSAPIARPGETPPAPAAPAPTQAAPAAAAPTQPPPLSPRESAAAPSASILGGAPAPTPPPAASPAAGAPLVTNLQGVNVRAQPGMGTSVLTTLPAAANVVPIGETVDANLVKWVQVRLPDGTTGWIRSDLLSRP